MLFTKSKRTSLRLPTSFLDILFNLVLVLAAISVVALLLINPIIKQNDVERKAEYLMTIDWDEGNHDVDVWIETPTGTIVCYQNKEADEIHIERDDLGEDKDFIEVNGELIANSLNEEIVVFRGLVPGDYVVSLHMFRSATNPTAGALLRQPVNATLRFEKLNPSLKLLFKDVKTFLRNREEIHVFRFRIKPDGDVVNIRTDMPKMLINQVMVPSMSMPSTPDNQYGR